MKCFKDSFAGLVPCIAMAKRQGEYGLEVQVRLTATRGAWKRGEVLWCEWRRVVPRSNVFTKRGTYGQKRIINYPVAVFDALPLPGIPMRSMRDFDKL